MHTMSPKHKQWHLYQNNFFCPSSKNLTGHTFSLNQQTLVSSQKINVCPVWKKVPDPICVVWNTRRNYDTSEQVVNPGAGRAGVTEARLIRCIRRVLTLSSRRGAAGNAPVLPRSTTRLLAKRIPALLNQLRADDSGKRKNRSSSLPCHYHAKWALNGKFPILWIKY